MAKLDVFRVIELASVFLFGFVGYLYTLWLWTKNNSMVVIFGILFFVILAILIIFYKVYKEEYSKKLNEGEKNVD